MTASRSFFPDAGSRVRGWNDTFVFTMEQSELHAPAGGREFQSIVDQVGDCLKKQVSVSQEAARRMKPAPRTLWIIPASFGMSTL
jgi:hypothetical protein